jgi:hypothetical protein
MSQEIDQWATSHKGNQDMASCFWGGMVNRMLLEDSLC